MGNIVMTGVRLTRGLEDVAAALRDAIHDLETFEWRGVDLLWGRS